MNSNVLLSYLFQISMKTTYEQFEIDSMLEESMDFDLNSLANVVGESASNGHNGFKFEESNGQNDIIPIIDLDDEEIVIETVETESTLFSRLVTIDDLHQTNESIVHQSITNDNFKIEPEIGSDSNFIVEMAESSDSIDMIKNQNESRDSDDSEFIPVDVILDQLKETKTAELAKEEIGTAKLNRKKLNEKRMATTTAYNESKLKRNTRIHTGAKPHQCNRCGKAFTNAASLKKHALTHTADFPFHCRVCFHGFSFKVEATAHEQICQKRRYECHLCKKFMTYVKSELIKHLRTHTGDKPFCCEICMKHFNQKISLTQHLKSIHCKASA